MREINHLLHNLFAETFHHNRKKIIKKKNTNKLKKKILGDQGPEYSGIWRPGNGLKVTEEV